MRLLSIGLAALVLSFAGVAAEAQTAVTASCKDGSSQTGASRRAACKGHGGVLSVKAAAAAAAPAAPAAADATPGDTAPSATAPLEQTAPAATSAPKPRGAHRSTTPIVARTPDNPTDVWVNSATKIYHCPGSRPYGKTKTGAFMTEAAAKTAGDRPSHNKSCVAASSPTAAQPAAR